jgi:NADPH:quinone reductase-like Zn-dependent oxidoreductase
MKAIVQDTYGGAEVLQLRDIEMPEPGQGQVRVKVHAAGCGPDVWHLMTGLPKLARLSPEFKRWWAHPRGRDFAGVVDVVGTQVSGLAAGDEVMGIAEGTFAEFAVVDLDKVVPKPAQLSMEQAAALPISGLTALQAVRDVAELKAGQRVAVLGAGGGVGTLAAQLAKAMGAEVTGIASSSKRDLVTSLGVAEFIDYTTTDFADGAHQWDAIIDTAGRRPLAVLSKMLVRGGVAAIVGGDGGGPITGGFLRGVLWGPLRGKFSSKRFAPVMSSEEKADLLTLVEYVEAGQLSPVVGQVFTLPNAAEALNYLETGHAAGKVVVTI